MDKRFIIIHPLEIIRKGLWAVLRESFYNEFILLASPEMVIDYSGMTNLHLVVFLGESYINDESKLFIDNMLGQHNKIIWIEIGNSGSYLYQSGQGISIEQSSDLIIEKVRMIIEKQKNNAKLITELTDRETDVLKLVAVGFSNKEIADKLFISIHTVISHRKNTTEKLGIKSISGLTVYAILNKLIDTRNIDPSSLI
ncbi:MAG: helix-turn-helix transcriptional regulator [Salinivirgaceae bacterium]|jgi:DNA-binding CsgD family transcriptional regulator